MIGFEGPVPVTVRCGVAVADLQLASNSYWVVLGQQGPDGPR